MKLVNVLLTLAVALTACLGVLLLVYAWLTVPLYDLSSASAVQITQVYTVMTARTTMGIALLLVAILCAVVVERHD